MTKKDEQKRGFATEQEARNELYRIVSTNYNTCKAKKPSRIYFSEVTKQWYLSSKPDIKIY